MMTSYSFKPSAINEEESIYDSIPQTNDAKKTSDTQTLQEFTLNDLLNELNTQEHLIQTLLDSLRDYLVAARKAFTPASAILNRVKLYLVSGNYSHAQEVEERLLLLKFLSTMCTEYKITKVQLKVIYDLLLNVSPVPSDQIMFLTWCKTCYEINTS